MTVDLEAEYREIITGHLEALSPGLTAQLRRVVAHTFSPAVACVEFEVFPDGLEDTLPVVMFTMDAGNTQLGDDDDLRDLVLADVPHVIPPDRVAEVRAPKFEDIETLNIDDAVLIAWVDRCWAEAGGRDFPLPCFIAPHDTSRTFDLRQGRWTTEAEKYRQITLVTPNPEEGE